MKHGVNGFYGVTNVQRKLHKHCKVLVVVFSFTTLAVINSHEVYAEDDAAPTFAVTDFLIEGDNPLSTSRSNRILQPFLNRNIDIAELRLAANELEKEMARKGYNFYRTTLPPQVLDSGTVKLGVKKVDIGNVSVLGNQFFSNSNIKRSLPLISEGASPNTQNIATALLLAEENPAKDIRVVFVKGKQPQTVDANITVKDKNPNEFFVWANNAGSQNTSRSRLGLQYHNRNLFGIDHQLSLSYSLSPEEPSELRQYGINYRVPFYGTRGSGNFFYSKSNADTGRVADVFDVSGAGETIGASYTQFLNKVGRYQHRLAANITDKLFDSDILFNTQNIGNDVRARPLSIEYTSRYDQSNWAFNSVLTATTNMSGGKFNDDASYAASRAGASQDWDKLNVTLNYDHRWNREWRGRVVFFAQTSSDPLISGEKFGLGGSLGSVGPRGFLEREVTVDKGYKFSLEANRSFKNGKFQLGAFFDYGTGKLNNVQVGEREEETLSSVGLSFGWNLRRDVALSLDYGYVLDGVEIDSGASASASASASVDGDDRVHLSIRYYPKWPFSGASSGGL
ncbi:hypothetical protein NBRC116583_10310 [Arenicella sp. 4NH20-0111]|uniref:ShlB/FhaC/HecB family hemolysin secretion/activation protein n=1 Tax=Arenicella sp. 4NH20-0111 TaxID=3127648 RepID=UPI003102C3D9